MEATANVQGDALDAAQIRLPGVEVRVLERCASTNSALFAERLRAPVLLATEEQTAGRGRRGRRWHSARGSDVTFSLARTLARPGRELAALSLVAGVAATRALRALGVSKAAIKWPNDLLIGDAKLGGILVETRFAGAASLAVIGVGINIRVDPARERRVRRQVAFLAELLAPLPSRNTVIERIGLALLEALEAFERRGFEALRGDWLALHAHAGRRLRVRLANGRTVTGIAAGLDEEGGLQLETRAGLRAIRSGQVLSARNA
jgi:BirA family biotin operon repressor/biotin-[acetyl-CoA-carboxylase] ligase